MGTQIRITHETVALGPPGVLIGDHDGLEDLPILLKVPPEGFTLCLPSQPADKDLGEGRVPEGRIQEMEAGARARPGSRARARDWMVVRHELRSN